ncbi:unnamed protein product [Durusdinium trenchii]|uniref:Uncharacterized protein n=1 Tax=Durusdinium trenchii TaxID=1381693 RepID=A0ABP0N0R4_9DINO
MDSIVAQHHCATSQLWIHFQSGTAMLESVPGWHVLPNGIVVHSNPSATHFDCTASFEAPADVLHIFQRERCLYFLSQQQVGGYFALQTIVHFKDHVLSMNQIHILLQHLFMGC